MKPIEQVMSNPLYFEGLRGLTTLPPNVWVVSKDTTMFPTPDYDTINEAITEATAGDTILVFPGTYDETVTINKSLTLYGNGAFVHPNVPGRKNGESKITNTYPVSIQAGSVVLNGFEVADFNTGIDVPASSFAAPNYQLSHITLSYNWIHSKDAWIGFNTQPGHLDDFTLSDSIIDIDKTSPNTPQYALACIALNGGAASAPRYSNISIRNNILKNSSGFYNIFAGSNPANYAVTNLMIKYNHFLTRSRAEINPGMSFNYGNITNGRFESNVPEDTFDTIGFPNETIQGNTYINDDALKLWNNEDGFGLPSRNVTIENNEFTDEGDEGDMKQTTDAIANNNTNRYNPIEDSGMTPGNTATDPWDTENTEDASAKSSWPLNNMGGTNSGFFPSYITGITYTGATCFEQGDCVRLSACVQFVGGFGQGIPVTFWFCGRKYFTRTLPGGIATVKIGSLCRGCYNVTACCGIFRASTNIRVICNCPGCGPF